MSYVRQTPCPLCGELVYVLADRCWHCRQPLRFNPAVPKGSVEAYRAVRRACGQWKQPDLEPAETVAGAPDTGELGVSLFDAAMILTDEDEQLAREMVRKWHRLREPRKPSSIGNCPNHKQRKLYAPSAFCDWAEEIEGHRVCREHQLRKRLLTKARKPRGD